MLRLYRRLPSEVHHGALDFNHQDRPLSNRFRSRFRIIIATHGHGSRNSGEIGFQYISIQDIFSILRKSLSLDT